MATNLSAAESYTEDATRNLTNIVITDPDSANVTATLTLSDPGAGSLTTATSGGVTSAYTSGTGVWSASGALANVNALLAGVSYVPTLNYDGDFTIATSVTDDASTPITGTKAMTGTAVNDAPVLANTALSITVAEDAGIPSGPVGSLVSAFTGGITDVDTGASKGIAIVASDETNGVWYYSTNSGTAWTAVGSVSGSTSLLLADNVSSRLYFAPAANYNGTSTGALTIRAWDQTIGMAGTKVSTASTGGTTAFSSATDTVDAVVTAVNDAPVLVATAVSIAFTENGVALGIDPGLAVTDVDSTNLTGATISITANFASGEDVLGFTTQNGITRSYAAGTGILTLTGTTTVANYQAALRSVTYANSSDNPSTATRTIAFVATASTTPRAASTQQVSVAAVNDAPMATNLSARSLYRGRDAQPHKHRITDPDSANVTATLTLSDPGAGSLTTATSGGVTSPYTIRPWRLVRRVARSTTARTCSTASAIPTLNYDGDFTIATSVTDDTSTSITGTKAMTHRRQRRPGPWQHRPLDHRGRGCRYPVWPGRLAGLGLHWRDHRRRYRRLEGHRDRRE